MKHLHVVQSLEPLEGGGLGSAAWQLHSALQLVGDDSTLFTTCASEWRDERAAVQFVRRGPTKAFYAPGLRARARAELRNPEVIVHGHGFYVYPNAAVGREARRAHVPLVYHPHGMFEPWILERSRKKKRLAHWLFEDTNFRHARLWRALTAREADQIRGQGISAPILVVPNGIDPAVFERRRPKQTSETKTLLFLGRLHPKKGIDLLLAAWAALRVERRGWRLKIAGPDEDGYATVVSRIIAQEGLADSVEILGPVVGAAKLDLFRQADAFVLTSYSEGLPMAVLEAMAAELPVIITDECNLPEASEVGAAWSCRADQASVTNVLRVALMSDEAELRQRGSAGRDLVLRKFQWSTIASELHAACAGLL